MAAVPRRSVRAITEYMSVVEEAPDLYTVVSESGKEYVVDLRDDPACTCPDFQYGADAEGCKHVRRAKLVTGRADVGRLRAELANTAYDFDAEAERLTRRAKELRTTARNLERTLDRLDELVEGRN